MGAQSFTFRKITKNTARLSLNALVWYSFVLQKVPVVPKRYLNKSNGKSRTGSWIEFVCCIIKIKLVYSLVFPINVTASQLGKKLGMTRWVSSKDSSYPLLLLLLHLLSAPGTTTTVSHRLWSCSVLASTWNVEKHESTFHGLLYLEFLNF